MISAVAFCPHPPLLVPEIASGTANEAELLRSACADALARLLATGCTQVVIIGGESSTRGLSGFAPGVKGLPDADLPPSLAIADWLLDRAGATPARRFVGVRSDGTPSSDWPALDERTGLVVMGDGSARRSVKGPGYLDDRAEAFDDLVVSALAAADVRVLADLDGALAAELLVAGIGPWKAAARIIGGEPRWQGEVLYADAPFGVTYVVACWLPE
jgi:hypothetical protein